MKGKLRGNLMLILTAFIWGTSFVAQKSGLDALGPISFNGIRTLIGGITLLPVIKLTGMAKARRVSGRVEKNAGDKIEETGKENIEENIEKKAEDKRAETKTLLIGGTLCGIALMAAGSLQQIGMIYTTAGKAGFITALYVVLVPVFGLFLGKRVRPLIWLCVTASAIGLYMLCMPSGGGFGHINTGDILVLVCAVIFTCHILIIDRFSPKVDSVKLSCVQFFVAGLLSLPLIWIDPLLGFSLPTMRSLIAVWLPLLYAGMLSCGVAYTLQVVAQSKTDPTIASMILCLESVFAVLAGMVILGESMTVKETLGCLIMFAAIVVSQLPEKTKERTRLS